MVLFQYFVSFRRIFRRYGFLKINLVFICTNIFFQIWTLSDPNTFRFKHFLLFIFCYSFPTKRLILVESMLFSSLPALKVQLFKKILRAGRTGYMKVFSTIYLIYQASLQLIRKKMKSHFLDRKLISFYHSNESNLKSCFDEIIYVLHANLK